MGSLRQCLPAWGDTRGVEERMDSELEPGGGSSCPGVQAERAQAADSGEDGGARMVDAAHERLADAADDDDLALVAAARELKKARSARRAPH